MKILFDDQIFTLLRFGGISRYFCELYNGLNNHPSVSAEVSVRRSVNINYQRMIRDNTTFRSPNPAGQFIRRVIGKIVPQTKDDARNRSYSKRLLSEGRFDIFHPTYYDPYFLRYRKNKPFVLTVYDMIHELFPECFQERVRQNMVANKHELINAASHIIAISEQTKRDIISLYGVSKEKISTIYLSSSFDEHVSITPNIPIIPSRYLLFVGTRDIYKNFLFFVNSVRSLIKENPDLYLVCAGPPLNGMESEKLKEWGIFDKVRTLFPNDDELIKLYSHAVCLVYPTKYEGFGLPVLEAFSCHCPVLTSRTSSIPEVGGNAVMYFDPSDAESIYYGVKEMITNEDLRATYIAKGKERVKLFSWEKTVKQTIEVYRSIY